MDVVPVRAKASRYCCFGARSVDIVAMEMEASRHCCRGN